MSKKELGGVIPALITPMNENGKVDFDLLSQQAQFLSDAGVHGFFVNGTTAEGPILTRTEKKEAVRVVKEASGGRQAICAACIAPSADQAIEEVRDLESVEPDYIVCVTPFYFPVNQAAIIDHYEKISKSTDLPLIFYDIPQHTGNPIAIETRFELIRRGLGVGFKDSTGNFVNFSRSIYESPKTDFIWIQGDDFLDAYSVEVGAKGVVTGLSNITPEPYLELFRRAEANDRAGMIDVQKRINAMAGVIGAANGRVIAGIKSAVAYLGRCEPWLRHRRLTCTDAETAAVRKVVDALAFLKR